MNATFSMNGNFSASEMETNYLSVGQDILRDGVFPVNVFLDSGLYYDSWGEAVRADLDFRDRLTNRLVAEQEIEVVTSQFDQGFDPAQGCTSEDTGLQWVNPDDIYNPGGKASEDSQQADPAQDFHGHASKKLPEKLKTTSQDNTLLPAPAEGCTSEDTGSQVVNLDIVDLSTLSPLSALLEKFEKVSEIIADDVNTISTVEDGDYGQSQSQPVSRTCSAGNSPVQDPPKTLTSELLNKHRFHKARQNRTKPITLVEESLVDLENWSQFEESFSLLQKITQETKLCLESELPPQVTPLAPTEPKILVKDPQSQNLSVPDSFHLTPGTTIVVKNSKNSDFRKSVSLCSGAEKSTVEVKNGLRSLLNKPTEQQIIMKDPQSQTSSVSDSFHLTPGTTDVKSSKNDIFSRSVELNSGTEKPILQEQKRIRAQGYDSLLGGDTVSRESLPRQKPQVSVAANRCLQEATQSITTGSANCLVSQSSALFMKKSALPAVQSVEKNVAIGSTNSYVSKPVVPGQNDKVMPVLSQSVLKNGATDPANTTNAPEVSMPIMLQEAENLPESEVRESILDHDYTKKCARRIIVDVDDLADTPIRSMMQKKKGAASLEHKPGKRPVSLPRKILVNHRQNTSDVKVNHIQRNLASQLNPSHGAVIASQMKQSSSTSFVPMASSSSKTLATGISSTEAVNKIASTVSDSTFKQEILEKIGFSVRQLLSKANVLVAERSDPTFQPVSLPDSTIQPVSLPDSTIQPVSLPDSTIQPVSLPDSTAQPVPLLDSTVQPVSLPFQDMQQATPVHSSAVISYNNSIKRKRPLTSTSADTSANASVSNLSDLTVPSTKSVCGEKTLTVRDTYQGPYNECEKLGSFPENEDVDCKSSSSVIQPEEKSRLVHDDTSFSHTENFHGYNGTNKRGRSWEDILEEQMSRPFPRLRTWEDTTDSDRLAKQAQIFPTTDLAQSDLRNAKSKNHSLHRKYGRPENNPLQDSENNCFSKIPPYLSEMSIPKQSGRKELRAEDIEGMSAQDFVPLDISSCEKQQEAGFAKIPDYFSCFSNSTKYDEELPFDLPWSGLEAAEKAVFSETRHLNVSSSLVPSNRSGRSRSRDRSLRGRKHSESSESPKSRSRSRSPKCHRRLSSVSESSHSSSASGSRSKYQASFQSETARSRSNSRSRSHSRSNSSARNCSRSSRERSRYDAEYDKCGRFEERRRRKEEKERDKYEKKVNRQVVYVGRIPDGFTRRQLREIFEPYGEIDDVSTHFREAQDNYGFVNFRYKSSADNAIANLKKDTKYKFDLCYGGRREFCRSDYLDLDGNRAKEEEFCFGQSNADLDYDELLRQTLKSQRQSRS